MSQTADAKCVILNLAYLEALDVLYGMQCQSTSDLERIILWDYRNDGDCTDTDEDCCVNDLLRKYSYEAEDCVDSFNCDSQLTIEPSYCSDITITML